MQAVHRYEQGETEPNPERLEQLILVFGRGLVPTASRKQGKGHLPSVDLAV